MCKWCAGTGLVYALGRWDPCKYCPRSSRSWHLPVTDADPRLPDTEGTDEDAERAARVWFGR